MRGWRLALTPPLDNTAGSTPFAPSFYLDEAHVYVTSVAFGADRFFALDTRRVSFPGWPCDAGCYAEFADDPPPNVLAYSTTGERDSDMDFEPYRYDVADVMMAITYAGGKLYVLNRNPPKVYVYTVHGRRVRAEDFYLAGGERYRDSELTLRENYHPLDFVHVAGRFYVLDRGSNRDAPKVFVYDIAGLRIPEAEFEVDGLRFESCGQGEGSCEYVDHIGHADGILYVKVLLNEPNERPVNDVAYWTYALAGHRTGTRYFRDALFTNAMTYANGWFFLVSNDTGVRPRIFTYPPMGEARTAGQRGLASVTSALSVSARGPPPLRLPPSRPAGRWNSSAFRFRCRNCRSRSEPCLLNEASDRFEQRYHHTRQRR